MAISETIVIFFVVVIIGISIWSLYSNWALKKFESAQTSAQLRVTANWYLDKPPSLIKKSSVLMYVVYLNGNPVKGADVTFTFTQAGGGGIFGTTGSRTITITTNSGGQASPLASAVNTNGDVIQVEVAFTNPDTGTWKIDQALKSMTFQDPVSITVETDPNG